ncbi:MAG: hypothetical protein AMXMBFR37_07140 [Steroidobacteraceae bacterium]|jgi:type IV secretion system protein VirB8
MTAASDGRGSVPAYFEEARSWEADRFREARRSARRAWWLAGAGWSCAVAGSLALLVLMPLKRVEPFVVRVDRSTGIVDVVPRYEGEGEVSEAVTRYFLSHYVATCERFTQATAESDYEECGAFHTAQRNQAWLAQWTPDNPDSPLNRYKDGSTVRVQVKAVTFFDRGSGLQDLAQVRFVRELRSASAAEPTLSHWIAAIQYAYGTPSTEARLRRWNPLGFKVVAYHTEPEVIDSATAASELAAHVATPHEGASP